MGYRSVESVLMAWLSALRVEWARTRARKQRWEEEVLLVQEEMRRVILFCHYRAEWWDKRVALRTDMFLDLRDGVRAYAAKQASILRKRAAHFTALWSTPPGTSGNSASVGMDADNAEAGEEDDRDSGSNYFGADDDDE